MPRTEVLVIRLSQDERTKINRLADAERLPASTLARKILLDEAERRGHLAKATRAAKSLS